MDDVTLQKTIRLPLAVAVAVVREAKECGFEEADYLAHLIAQAVTPTLHNINPDAAKQVEAEAAIKVKAIDLARQLCPAGAPAAAFADVTLRVFQRIRTDPALQSIYLQAIGNRPGDERGNPLKARLNRTLGASIKTAVDGRPQKVGGNPVKIQVSGEYIFSFTPLEPSSDAQ